MRTPPPSSRVSAAAIVAAGSPRLPPSPSRTSTTAAALDAHADESEHGVDRRRRLADFDLDPLDRREARERGLRDRLGGGFDERIALRREGLDREPRERVVSDGLAIVVALARRPQIEVCRDVERKALAEAPLLREDAVAGEDLEVADEDAVAHAAAFSAPRTASACTCAATSWTRTISAPLRTPKAFAAIVPGSRAVAAGWGSNRRPIKDFRDTPRSTGK